MNETTHVVVKKEIWKWTEIEDDPWTPLEANIYNFFIVIELFGSMLSIVLVIHRRNVYPINATPVIWNILSHLTSPLSVIYYGVQDVFAAMYTHPVTLFIGYMTVFWPLIPAICARLLYILRSYEEQVQIERQKKYMTSSNLTGIGPGGTAVVRHHRRKLTKNQQSVLLFIALSLLSCLYPFGVVCDVFLFPFERDPNILLQFSPGVIICWLFVFLSTSVCAFLALKLKDIKEEFNLKLQYLCYSLWFLTFGSSVLMIICLGLHRISGTMLLVAKSLYIVLCMGCTMFCGLMPLIFSFREERLMRKRIAQRSSRVFSENGGAGLYTVKNGSDLKKILSHPKNAAHLDAFQKYMIKEFCVENVLFVRSVMILSDYSDKSKLLAAVQRILNEHIRSGVNAEVNISVSLRKQTLDMVSRLTEETVTDTVYQHVEHEVYMMMLDSFNRFLVKEEVSLEYIPVNIKPT